MGTGAYKPPYGPVMAAHGDWGMTASDAEALAETVRRAGARQVTVEPENDYFLVVVRPSDADTVTLGGEEDWAWLRGRILGT